MPIFFLFLFTLCVLFPISITFACPFLLLLVLSTLTHLAPFLIPSPDSLFDAIFTFVFLFHLSYNISLAFLSYYPSLRLCVCFVPFNSKLCSLYCLTLSPLFVTSHFIYICRFFLLLLTPFFSFLFLLSSSFYFRPLSFPFLFLYSLFPYPFYSVSAFLFWSSPSSIFVSRCSSCLFIIIVSTLVFSFSFHFHFAFSLSSLYALLFHCFVSFLHSNIYILPSFAFSSSFCPPFAYLPIPFHLSFSYKHSLLFFATCFRPPLSLLQLNSFLSLCTL